MYANQKKIITQWTVVPQIQLGWRSYVLPKLSHLTKLILNNSNPFIPSKQLPAHQSSSSIHSLPLTTQSNSQCIGHSSQGVIVEKLPSFIHVPSQLVETTFTIIPQASLQRFVFFPLLLKELCLQSTVEKLLEVIPQPWRKVSHIHLYMYTSVRN